MKTTTLTINGEVFDVTAMAQPFTHEAPTGFFSGLGEYEVLDTVIGQSLGAGLFTAEIKFKSENEPTVDNLQSLLSEYPDADVTSFLDTESGILLATGGKMVTV